MTGRAAAGETSSAPVDEKQLLDAIRAGNRGAAERIVERTYAGVFAALYRLSGNSDTAADLTQETYQKAWTALADFDGRSRLSTWLYRIAYTTFLNSIRRLPTMLSLDDETAPQVRDGRPAPDDILGGEEEAARLRQAVLSLPPELQFTVTAHYWAELPVGEIAQLEKITAVAVRKRLRRAYALLEAALDDGRR
jgi:RNA polymerase sigma-70 factor (ECF subfamily)